MIIDLKDLSKNIGHNNLEELIYLIFNINLNILKENRTNNFKCLIDLIQDHFNINRYIIYDAKLNNETKVVIYNSKNSNNPHIDNFNKMKDDLYFSFTNQYSNILHDYINIYIKYDCNILILYGHFNNDINDLIKNKYFFNKKNK